MKRRRSGQLTEDSPSLIFACTSGRLEDVMRIVRESKKRNETEFNFAMKWAWYTIFLVQEFIWFSEGGYPELVKLLIEKKTKPELDEDFCLRKASEEGQTEVVKILLANKKVNPRVQTSFPLRISAERGHVAVVQLLLADSHSDPQACQDEAVVKASRNGHVEVVGVLLKDKRVSPQAQHNLSIREAASNGHLEVVKLLLADRRVTPAACDNRALKNARANNHVEITKLLIESTPRNQVDDDATWKWACSNDYLDVLSILIDAGKPPSLSASEKSLEECCREGNYYLAKFLLVDRRITFRRNSSPLITASIRGNLNIVKLLIRDSRFVAPEGGAQAIREAYRFKHLDIATLLLTNEAIMRSVPATLLLIATKNKLVDT